MSSEASLRATIASAAGGSLADVAAGAAAQHDLALLLSQQGRHAEADALLSVLGLRYKLSPAIMCPRAPKPAAASAIACAYDGALPLELVRSLQRGFAPASSFFSEHRYPTPGFFSYAFDLRSEPSTLPEAAALALLPLVQRRWPAGAPPPESVEWWVHSRAADGGHQLHWDMDEARLRASGRVSHPALSAVLYLSDEGACAQQPPTLVTSQTLGGDGDDDGSASAERAEGWLARPRPNRLLLFEGDRLHGVVPRAAAAAGQRGGGGGGGEAGHRLTLMFGWWPKGSTPAVCSTPTLTGAAGRSQAGPSLGPCMAAPLPGKRTAPKWCRELRCGEEWAAAASAGPKPKPAPLEAAGKVWAAVKPSKPSKSSAAASASAAVPLLSRLGAGSVEFIGRFFVSSLSQIRAEVLGPAACDDEAEEGDDDGEEFMDLEEARRLAESQRGGLSGGSGVDGDEAAGGGEDEGEGESEAEGEDESEDGGEFMDLAAALRLAAQQKAGKARPLEAKAGRGGAKARPGGAKRRRT